MNLRLLIITILVAATFAGCRKDEPAPPSVDIPVDGGGMHLDRVRGFYLLNEGNMGSNKASLDVFDYERFFYTRNIFPERNPGVVKELGDVGNDLKIYGSRLYAVINCSNLVEVMRASDAVHIGVVSIPNCRYIAFEGPYAYVSSYAGPVAIDPNARLGYVAKIDTATLQVVAECTVGYQPEEMVITGGKLYVANSGGYRVPNYDRTVSVIDLATFTEVKKIDVAINLHRMRLDSQGMIWVSSRGDYKGNGSSTHVIDPGSDAVIESYPIANSNMAVCGDSIYFYSTEWNAITATNSKTYGIIDTRTRELVSTGFIKDGTEADIRIAYGIAVNPESREIFVTDAGDYVTPGTLHCYSPEGIRKWSVTTGDIPASIVFF